MVVKSQNYILSRTEEVRWKTEFDSLRTWARLELWSNGVAHEQQARNKR